MESTLDAVLQRTLKRDRALIALALAVLTALAWFYLWWYASGMAMQPQMDGMEMPEGMGEMAAPAFHAWSAVDFALMFAMWVVMMVGMMTPSAAPMILLYARVARQAAEQGQPFAAVTWFASGYFLAWIGFAAVVTLAQWLLERAALLTPMLASNSNLFGGIVLIAAGLYQWTPLKNACLTQCQSPLAFIQRYGGFPSEARASMRLGARHGAYCVGCCWALMALLFVGGIMNLLWIALIAIFVLIEKAVVRGFWISRVAGVAASVAGIWLLTQGL